MWKYLGDIKMIDIFSFALTKYLLHVENVDKISLSNRKFLCLTSNFIVQ